MAVAVVEAVQRPGVVAMRLGVVRPAQQAVAATVVGLQAAEEVATAVIWPAATNTTATAGSGIVATAAEGRLTTAADGPIGSVLWRALMAKTSPAVPRKR